MRKGITIKQNNFLDEFIRNGGNATEAYKHAYNAENMKYETIASKACLLLKQGNITAKLEEKRAILQEAVNEEFKKTKLDILREWEELKKSAKSDSDKNIIRDCLREQGKLLGFYVELSESKSKTEIVINGKTETDIKALIQGIKK